MRILTFIFWVAYLHFCLFCTGLRAQSASKKVLIVATNHQTFKDTAQKTGAWLGEITHFYEVLQKAGYELDIVSPKGGKVILDPKSTKKLKKKDKILMQDPIFLSKLEKSFAPEQINASDYAAIYYAGGHGVMWDFPNNEQLMRISQQIYSQKGAVTGVCHGVAGLLNIKDASGSLLIKGKNLTGFSNKEEKLAGKTKLVPFALETELLERGVQYHKSLFPFRPKVVKDGAIITGQNPASAKKVGIELLKWLKII